ncbi:MAG: DNA repair protein RecN [Bacteroidota bacterium]
MLRSLSIQNYALIDKLEIDFPDDLTVITGETGAGKSILLGALSLIAGNRADIHVLQDKSRKCVVEGVFNLEGYGLKDFFSLHELDYADETVVRREINPEGKSRAFINDTPVNLSVLKGLGDRLIDIHSQHETLTLHSSGFQMGVVDAYAGHAELLESYRNAYRDFRNAEQRLAELREKEAQSKKDLDYFQFQFYELEDARLKAGEQASMEQELETLSNTEEIKKGLSSASHLLEHSETNLLFLLNEVRSTVASLSRFNPSLKGISERINSVYIELKDIAADIAGAEESTVHDPQRIEELNEKLDAIYRLQKKHGVNKVEELLEIKEALSNKLLDITSLDEQISALEKEAAKMGKTLAQQAARLSAGREAAIPGIEREIGKMLASLGIPHARFAIQQEKTQEPGPNGSDRISFLFSANKGSDARELSKVASGGELSRLMLSIKALVARLTRLPVIVFDEIDTGVSGEVANRVGGIMEQMGKAMQVIVITHLAQIASKGDSHLFVYKEIKGGKTFTRIKKLDREERVMEIAKMLSTENPTQAAIKNAKELLNT